MPDLNRRPERRSGNVYHDREKRGQVYLFLASIWPHLGEGIPRAERWDAAWHAVSTPFVRFAAETAIAHVGVIPVPLEVAGEAVEMAGIHAVCTRAAYRGRGLSRTLMEEALAYCDARFPAAFLTTEEPDLYTRYGFRLIPQQIFVSELAPSAAGEVPRRLSLDDAADRALLERLLATRNAVSQVLGTREPGWLFKINVSLWSAIAGHIHYLEELDCAVVYRIERGTLRIYDLVATELPPLMELVARIGQDAERLELFFTPDRLQADRLRPVPLTDGNNLMVRGPFRAEGTPLILPPLARC
ncbi:hypothetical protein BH24GEM2_BH24GEM2_08490 [soil metagenome]